MGVLIAQLAVVAAARRAGRIPPADALREVAIEHPRPGVRPRRLPAWRAWSAASRCRILFSGFWAMAFAVLGGILLAMGTGLLGRWLLGVPAALLAAPLRRFGAPGLLAATGLAANRWRTAALATPIVLVAMLAGTQGIVESSNQRHTEDVTRLRVDARRRWSSAPTARRSPPAPPPRSPARRRRRRDRRRADRDLSARRRARDQSPWPAAGLSGAPTAATLDPDVVRGSLADVGGDAVAVSRVFADGGDLRVGDTVAVRMADTAPPRSAWPRSTTAPPGSATSCSTRPSPGVTPRVAADTALFVAAARPPGGRSRATRPSIPACSRSTATQYLDTVHASNVDGAVGRLADRRPRRRRSPRSR